jgi:penicillin-binding protein 2
METLVSTKTQSWLYWFLRGALILGFLILFGRLIELSIIKGEYFRLLSEENRIRRIPISAPRGRILARGGQELVGNQEILKTIIFNPESGYEKVDYKEGDPKEETITEWLRVYKLGAALGHVSGYLGQISEEEVGKVNPKCPEKGPRQLGDWVGRSGLEEEYECSLSGIDGEELVEVDTSGKKIRTLGKKEPIPGTDLKTSIDLSLQEAVAASLGSQKGAVVAVNGSGEVLALYSYPSFDPNLFVSKGSDSQILALLSNPDQPFFNRAIGGLFHPGSVFKPIVAIAAVEEGEVDENFVYQDPGVISIGSYSYSNWYFNQYGRTEGAINLVRAIARSTDTFFYKLGEFIGVDKLSEWAKKFGLNAPSGIDIPGEVAGLVPSPEWKLKVKGERWFLGNTYHMAIGQGDIALTPIALNRATLAIATGGKLCQPKIGREPSCSELKLKDESIRMVKEGMQGACLSGGTGYTFFDFEPKVGCKTGTAETALEGEPHAWFTVFAPIDFPEITLTVLVEKGGEGSKVAGPIAKQIFDYWFHGTIPSYP